MFIAGYNIPGYLPDADPLEFDSTYDAWQYLRDLHSESWDQVYYAYDDSEVEDIDAMHLETDTQFHVQSFDDPGDLFGADGYVYWVSIAEGN